MILGALLIYFVENVVRNYEIFHVDQMRLTILVE